MSGLLNERITALRKERGFTQEQLGQMVGVSAQAVSKWEKGGFPDVELLPAVAGALGVTIDALFGRDAGERIDAAEVVRRWLRTMPQSQRMDQLSELVWAAASLTVATHSDDNRLLSGKRDKTCQEASEGRLAVEVFQQLQAVGPRQELEEAPVIVAALQEGLPGRSWRPRTGSSTATCSSTRSRWSHSSASPAGS